MARSLALPKGLVSNNVKNVALAGVTEPITTRFIELVLTGAITILPVPLGLIVTLVLLEINCVCPVVVIALNLPSCGTTPPIAVLSIVLVVPMIVLVNVPVTAILG